jgi:vancomycin permeability regulator SanA
VVPGASPLSEDGAASPGRGRPRRRKLGWLVVLVLCGGLGIGGPSGFTHLMSAGRIVTTAADAPSMDVAMVLGASIYPDGTPSPYLKGRLDLAVQLYQLGKVKVILVSGDGTSDHYDEPTGMKNYLVKQGIPADKIVADPSGYDTYDSCVRAKQIYGVNRMLVVSQSYHLPRAITTCRLVGVDAYGVGDSSVEKYTREWTKDTVRELGANIKMVWDVGTHRDPTLGPKLDSVQSALGQ